MLAFLLAAVPTAALPLGVTSSDKCASANSHEVVVCGSRERNQRYRLPKLADKYKPNAIRAETSIAGTPAGVHVSEANLPGGQKSKRLMLTISTAF